MLTFLGLQSVQFSNDDVSAGVAPPSQMMKVFSSVGSDSIPINANSLLYRIATAIFLRNDMLLNFTSRCSCAQGFMTTLRGIDIW
jgi:hypothetical protein